MSKAGKKIIEESADITLERMEYAIMRAGRAEIEKAVRDATSGLGVMRVTEDGIRRIDPSDFYKSDTDK